MRIPFLANQFNTLGPVGVDVDVDSARAVMEAAEAKMIEDPMNQKALDRLLEAQATYEAVGGLTQDRLVAQV